MATNKKQDEATKVTSVSLDLSMLTDKVDALKALDAKLNSAKGTIAEQLKHGDSAADSMAIMGLGDTLGDTITTLKLQLSIVTALHEECRNAWIKANVSSTEVDALKAQRDKLVDEAEAVRKVLVSLGLDGAEAVELPSAPSVRRLASANAPATLGSKGISFYYRKGNEKVYKAGSQNTLSSLAFYAPCKATVSDLKDALKAAGWDGTLTTTQEYTVNLPKNDKAEARTVMVGWTVHEADKAPEAPEADEAK